MKIFFLSITLVVIMVLVAGIAWYRLSKPLITDDHAPLTRVELEIDSVGMGTFPYAETKEAVFKFKNAGEFPLIIKKVIASCGCTDIRWNKKPILPGMTDSLIVHFTPNSLGRFTKKIDMITNTLPGCHSIHLHGFVEE